MTFRNIEIDLLQAHYAGLEQRLDEMEEQLALVNRGIHTLIGGGDSHRLRLIKEDRTQESRKEIPPFKFDVNAEFKKIKRRQPKDKKDK